jgi:hypothetical protein
LASAGEIHIDGRPAVIGDDGICISPNQADLGEHTVWSSSATRRYLIVSGQADWEPWTAHLTPNANICGAAVFPLAVSQPHSRQIIVPAGEFSLIGARPGMVHHCTRDHSSRSTVSVAFPSFDPVWLVPRFPLRCDRRAARVRRLSSDLAPPSLASAKPKAHRDSVREWTTIILDAHRRKLILDPADAATSSLWEEYERAARSIWRRLK